MTEENRSRLVALLGAVSTGAAVALVGIGGLVLTGWIFDIAVLKSFGPGLGPMKASTAAAFVLAGVSLWLSQTKRASWRPGRYLAWGLASIVVAVGLLALVEYLSGRNLSADGFPLGQPPGAGETTMASRPAPNTALETVLIGLSLVLLDVRTRKGRRPAQYSIVLVGVVALVVLTGYLYNASSRYTAEGSAHPMSLPAVLAGVIAFVGLGLARPGPGLLALLGDNHVGSVMARRFLFPLLLVPILLDVVLLEGRQAGLYGEHVGAGLHVVLQTAFFLGLVWITAASLNRTDAARREAEREITRLASFPMLNPNPIVEVEADGRVCFANPTARRLFPDLPQRGPGHPWLADWASVMGASHEGADLVSREVALGDRRYLQAIHLIPGIGRVRIYGEDITERARVEQSLAKERANLQTIFDVVNVGMLLIDKDGAVKRVNDTVSRWVRRDLSGRRGVQPGDLVGCIYATADPAGCGHGPRCASCSIRNTFESVLRSGQPVHDVEAEATLSVDGNEVRLWLEVSADPLVLDGEQHVVLALNNITARKLAEQALARAAEELSRSNKDLEQFAYVASHDLQEPLRMVTGYMQLLSERYKGRLDDKADQYIAYAVDGAQRMATLIRDLLAYSRVNTRAEPLRPTNSQDVLDLALRNLRVSIEQSGAAITHDPLPVVRADRAQLARLLQNLVGNAVKYRAADRRAEIHVSARQEPGQWVFSVRDNGIGFEQQYEPKIFMIFQRLHGRGQYAGTGIGLAICKRIVERHGGRIWATSEPGKGSVFFFTIPT